MRLICRIIFLSLSLSLLFSCDKTRVYDQVIEIPKIGWLSANKVNFAMPVTDTTGAYDILLHLRNNGNYNFSNIWLFVETKSPNGNMLLDTFEIMLADDAGRWLGKGIGDVNEMLVPYKQNIAFPFRGVYQVSVQQAMRIDTLRNVLDVGLRLQYHK